MIDLRFLEEGKAIRDPIWGYIHIPPDFLPLVDAEEFQRLRDISQLGHVLLVYPGARHSRFEHALGVFHIAGHFLKQLLKTPAPSQYRHRRRARASRGEFVARHRALSLFASARRNADVFY